MINENVFYNMDCIEGCKKLIKDNSVDLIITDPPYGINGDKLHKHYNRNENFVLDGYIEIPQEKYLEFSKEWIKQAERILRPGGSIYIISGYTNLIDILISLKETSLIEVNHLIWKYNFGVYTTKKYISSHYHILYYVKPGGKVTFDTFCRYGNEEKDYQNGSLNYRDREDVWIINREYKPGIKKNKNELPKSLLTKIIQYSSNQGDIVCDLFLGSFSTAKVAIGLNRTAIGFEKSKIAFDYQINAVSTVKQGELLEKLKKPIHAFIKNQGKEWTKEEIKKVWERYKQLFPTYKTKKKTIECLCKEFQRGRFSISKLINNKEREEQEWNISMKGNQLNLF